MKLQLKLAPKLALIFVAFALLVVLGLGTPIYYYGRSVLLDSRVSDLVSAAIEKQAALAYWVEERERDLGTLADSPHLAKHFGKLDERSSLAGEPAKHLGHCLLVVLEVEIAEATNSEVLYRFSGIELER